MRFAAVIAGLVFAASPALAQSPVPAMPKLPKTVKARYSCSALTVPVTYDNVKNRALIQYGSRRYTLPHVASADGARYANSKIEWWSKGTTATLSSVSDGKAGPVLANCEQLVKK